MKKVSLSWLLPILLVIGGAIIFFGTFSKAESATATHIVISEVQIGKTGVSTDEFVELYNPTSSDVNLSSWRLGRKTQSGADQTDLVSSISGTIQSHGYLLIASADYSGTTSADIIYATASGSIANNNTIVLVDNSSLAVDMVGMGSATASESSAASNPPVNKSIERRSKSSSDETSMGIGGIDEFEGNGEDSNNNSIDFTIRDIPQPQNSSSAVEPTPVPTPTNTPIPTPTVVPTEIPTPTPTIVPTAIPTPTLEPTSAPIPTVTPSPTLSPAPTASITPTPTGIPVFPRFTVVCSTKILNFNFGFIHIRIPFLTCRLIRA